MPVSIVTTPGDSRCPMEYAEWMFTEITTPDKHLVVNNGNHYTVQWSGTASFVNLIEETAKNGTIVDEASYGVEICAATFALLFTLQAL